ncbi:hypothetical protein C1A40_08785 [Tamlana carrageenivorans]|uniref:Uncharacterized protein n=1 Tax=Pseudotamlana carrageenivorans TaxID=2069432 RepID=A0A2I7SI72_9FLAO|nr:hypothetical protein C1A40_08785 [Tamlana carrageenivorans]
MKSKVYQLLFRLSLNCGIVNALKMSRYVGWSIRLLMRKGNAKTGASLKFKNNIALFLSFL